MNTYADLLANRPKPVPADYGWIGVMFSGALMDDADAERSDPGMKAPLLASRDYALRYIAKEAGVG